MTEMGPRETKIVTNVKSCESTKVGRVLLVVVAVRAICIPSLRPREEVRDVGEQPNVAHLDFLLRLEPNDAIQVVDVPDQKYLRFQEFRKYHDLIGYQVVEDEHKAQILVFQI